MCPDLGEFQWDRAKKRIVVLCSEGSRHQVQFCSHSLCQTSEALFTDLSKIPAKISLIVLGANKRKLARSES